MYSPCFLLQGEQCTCYRMSLPYEKSSHQMPQPKQVYAPDHVCSCFHACAVLIKGWETTSTYYLSQGHQYSRWHGGGLLPADSI